MGILFLVVKLLSFDGTDIVEDPPTDQLLPMRACPHHFEAMRSTWQVDPVMAPACDFRAEMLADAEGVAP